MTSVAVDRPDTAASQRTLRGFDEIAARIAGAASDPAWLAELRHAARTRFAEVGLPGSKDEEWRFTPLTGLASVHFAPAAAPLPLDAADLGPYVIGTGDWPLLVMIDGRVDPRLSRLGGMPAGVTFGSLGEAIAEGNPLVERHLARHARIESTPFAAVNAALAVDGAFLHLPAGVVLPAPVQVVHFMSPGATAAIHAPRVLVVADAGSQGVVIETYAGAAGAVSLTSACTEVILEAGARIEHVRTQREGIGAWHVGFTAVSQQRHSHYRSFALATGARTSRHDLHARLAAPDVETLLYGLYLARGDQLVDNHTTIFHDHPRCNSWEVYKGVLAERAHGVFNGKVLVTPEAQKTDAKQTNRNLLLSDQARIHTKPQLEIFADDVKCTHGATVGKLDEQQRYYLRTRGIAGRAAEVLLITAFVAEVVMEIAEPRVRTAIDLLVSAEMEGMIG